MKELLRHLPILTDPDDEITFLEERGGEHWLGIKSQGVFTPRISMKMNEALVARLRDTLSTFRTTEEAKIEAKAYGETVE